MCAAIHDGQRLTLGEYLQTPMTRTRFELAFGVVREPAAPSWNHQQAVGRLFTRLDRHVRRLALGQVGLSPLDVILDMGHHLVVQPDIIVVLGDKAAMIQDRIWGAPDLAVEVLSPTSSRYDAGEKKGWYRDYGVREQWLVNPWTRAIDVVDLTVPAMDVTHFDTDSILRSKVLPRLRLHVAPIFDAVASTAAAEASVPDAAEPG